MAPPIRKTDGTGDSDYLKGERLVASGTFKFPPIKITMKTHLVDEIQTTPELEQRIKNDAILICALSWLIASCFILYVLMELGVVSELSRLVEITM